jgi:signal transduction histidine kinase
MAVMMALQGAAFVVATLCARYFGGVLGTPHRVAERLETVVTAAVASGLIYLSGSAASFFWFLVVAHVLHGAADAPNASFARWSHIAALTLAALGFLLGDMLVDAATVVFCGGVIFFLARTQERWQLRILELEVERNLLRRRVETILVEQERQRIARDLHDGLGAQLAAMAWSADASLLGGGDSAQKLRELSERARAGLSDLRQVVNGLKAEAMALDGLADAVEQRCRMLVPQTCSFSIEHRGDLRIARDPCAQLELMIRESVRNAVQHAQAGRIRVALHEDGDELRVSIDDDGQGLPEGAAEQSRGGLSHLRERAESIGAVLRVSSSEVGTSVRIHVKRALVAAS